MGSLSGQRIVVIGGSAGIGLAVAQGALAEGASVFIGSHNPERVRNALGRLGMGADGAAVDTTDQASLSAFFDAAGALDHLVYTAGDWTSRKIALGPDFNLDDARGGLEVRYWGAIRAINTALPAIARTGSIVLTSGLISRRPQRGRGLACGMAGAVEHLARGLAIDLAPIRVNVVTPGYIATEVFGNLDAEAVSRLVGRQPLPRMGQPEEVAEAYLYFMRAGYTTGQSAIVDGAMLYT
jgi:NAD(P)-dependent dehydrogenase (short-subunit alcohol dehydrogenase family)